MIYYPINSELLVPFNHEYINSLSQIQCFIKLVSNIEIYSQTQSVIVNVTQESKTFTKNNLIFDSIKSFDKKLNTFTVAFQILLKEKNSKDL